MYDAELSFFKLDLLKHNGDGFILLRKPQFQ